MELLDILDEEGNPTGKVADRRIVHEKGLWHRHVGVWIMNSKGEILLQKRAKSKKVNPNKWTITGGHTDAGEDVIEGIQRETAEEIGVIIPNEKFELIKIEKLERLIPNTNIITRNYSYLYFVLVDYSLTDYTMQKEEVSDLKYITIEEMEEARRNKDESYNFTKWDTERFDEIVKWLKKRREKI